jgi:subtilisin family serine protease
MQPKITTVESKINKIYEQIKEPVIYSPLTYGLPTELSGRGVNICLIDSGTPEHKDINVDGDKIIFCDNTRNTGDKTGHATMVAGLISSKNKQTITGIAPNATIHYAKVIDDSGNCNFNSVVAAVLWAIVKQVHIIILPIGTQWDYTILHDAITKANKMGIIVIASAGNNKDITMAIDFPSQYLEVWSVASFLKNKTNKLVKKKVDFSLNASGMMTTYVNNKYVKASGSSLASAIVGGLTAILIEQCLKKSKEIDTQVIYNNLVKTLS